MKIFDAPDLTNPLAAAQKRLAAAEKSVQDAKEESRSARRKRKEAKLAARRAKKQLKRAREERDDAQRALAQEEANDALRLKIVRAQKAAPRRRVKLPTSRTKAKRRMKSVVKKRDSAPAAADESNVAEGTPGKTVPVESISAGDFQLSPTATEIASPNTGAEPIVETTEQAPQHDTQDWRT